MTKRLINEFIERKSELKQAIADKLPVNDLEGYWDELEQAWYSLIDEYDLDWLERTIGPMPEDVEGDWEISYKKFRL